MEVRRVGLISASLGLPLLAIGPGVRGGGTAPDFEREIRPLLARRCLACHGAARQENGLRLDLRQRALEGGDSGPAVVPGRSAESRLLLRVQSAAPKKRMPPGPSSLPGREIALLRAWIDSGAGWGRGTTEAGAEARHWSFRELGRPIPPVTSGRAWVRNPIDAFILSRLERSGILPSPEADPDTLLRRASLDLIGLQPGPEELQAYREDRQPGAYERAVDRLLASPHFGERWARFWLDQARYADSNGYTIDSARSIWKYRDWVIGAFNRDLPFDQFTIEQFAGDLLPGATPEQVVATGFHRNTLINEEGGTDKEQFRVESVVDRVNTTGAVFLGLTIGCAQCHSHKYDPITQREYYQLFAFLNNQEEPAVGFPTPEQSERQATLKRRLEEARGRLRDVEARAAERREAWEKSVLSAGVDPWLPARLEVAKSPEAGDLPIPDSESYLLDVAPMATPVSVILTLQPPPGRVAALRLDALLDPRLPGRGPGLTPHGNFVLSEFQVRTEEGGRLQGVALAAADADYHQSNMPASAAIDGDPGTGWGVYAADGHQQRSAAFLFKSPVTIGPETRLVVTLTFAYRTPGYVIGRGRISVSPSPVLTPAAGMDAALAAILRKPSGQRSPEEAQRADQAFQATDRLRQAAVREVDRIQAELKQLDREVVTTLVLRERTTPRETHIHLRGDFLRKGDRVNSGVPAVLPPLSVAGSSPNRLDLARWLVDPRNPLTPRVTVNRIWQQLFGTGLVETENDFGKQGSRPTHPELLNWLADCFRSPRDGPRPGLGWSVKSLLRLIVTSSTYRQSSMRRPDLMERDPSNRLLARQNRLRLDAELIRDVSLRASGLLAPRIGGPSVFPPQPAGLDAFTQNRKNWQVSQGEDRYRRGLYTFIWRSSPYAIFAALDAPSGNLTCTRRPRSNTPIGALMLANDGALFEMAQALAKRLQLEAGPGAPDEARIRLAYRLCVSREPTPDEIRTMLRYLQEERAATAGSPDLAAWTSVARVLMNLDEFICRE